MQPGLKNQPQLRDDISVSHSTGSIRLRQCSVEKFQPAIALDGRAGQRASISPSLGRGLAMDDTGDFKKARGFLFTYSCLVLGLWYFKAELTQFNLMGVTLAFTHRKESIWLVVALVNAYFWFRFYQRLPRNALYFDDAMHDLYDKALVWLALKWKRRQANALVETRVESFHTRPDQIWVGLFNAEAIGRKVLAQKQRHNGDEAQELHQISRKDRTRMHLLVEFRFAFAEEEGNQRSGEVGSDYQPPLALAWSAKGFAMVKGAFITPWFTDYVAPLALGFISTCIALWRWWEVNFTVGGL